MIVRSKTSKMGIDWRLAYEELHRITQMMKLGFAKGKKKKGKGRHGSRYKIFYVENCPYFLIFQFQHILWVLKRSVSLRLFF